jgi:hypothetical protein
MNKDIKESLPGIKDKFDTYSTEQLVLTGYPENAERYPTLFSGFVGQMIRFAGLRIHTFTR